ncbi:MAG: DNA repair protein RecN (Recombination protein N) [Alphaproteobacteria bacterium]|jgi:DNA repair protein RecN (Recombination protein N)
MLVHIAIKNLAIVKKVDLTLGQGLTAITGETGAGKSIALDALGLCLGDRAESNMVRDDADKAEVVAHFDIAKVKNALEFLIEHELQQDDNPDECFIRRVINPEGRSKAFVNGIPVNLSQLKALGSKLAFIHSQHAHYQFLKPEFQRKVLDQYAQHSSLLMQVAEAYKIYHQTHKQLNQLEAEQQQRLDRSQLLAYQVKELDDFSIGEGEFASLENDFKKLSNTQELIDNTEFAIHTLKTNDDANALSLLQQSIKSLNNIAHFDDSVNDTIESLQNALIQAEDACNELEHYQTRIEADPEQLAYIETRYSGCMDLARKHQVQPEALYETHLTLAQEYQSLVAQEDSLTVLGEEVQTHYNTYLVASKELSDSRTAAAEKLSEEIQVSIREMNLPHAAVDVRVKQELDPLPTAVGNDIVQIYLSVNPGQASDLMDKVVSGGELSRIGLALQVISAKDTLIPTMVFDEVDTGISGPTASLVGKLLRRLGEKAQVMCVTHLPQVAAQAHNQLFVSKVTDGKTTETTLLKLTKEERINEIARLLAGDELTDTAIANAKDLLKL